MSGQTHPFHVVNPSPWPLAISLALFLLAVGAVLAFKGTPEGSLILGGGALSLFYILYRWWRDVVHEARVEKAHTSAVRHGMRIGMAVFILSEVMFFGAFFWSFFHSAFFPEIMIEGEVWSVTESMWPPEHIKTFDPLDLPFLNTLILLLSGTTLTWAHYSLMAGNKRDLVRGLALTVALGVIFTMLQAIEYQHAAFSFTEGIYPSIFFMVTGFHGFHVIIGTIFLFICLLRARKGHFTVENHLGFELAAWYWHFVDVVWLFLFVFVYVWGS